MWFIRELNTNHIFTNPVVQKTFPRYLRIIQNVSLARFLLAKQLAIDPWLLKENNQDSIWSEYENISFEFRENIINWDNEVIEIKTVSPNYLDLKVKLASLLESPCRICERKCDRKRAEDEIGFCLVPEKGAIASAFLHYGEEPVLLPSGTIFFNGCTFR